jgi:hypothetical protein
MLLRRSASEPVLPGKQQLLIVLDWDDTMIATTWLKTWLEKPPADRDPPEDGAFAELSAVSEAASKTLEAAERLGASVVLVTNALQEWLDLSLTMMPALQEAFARVGVVVHARPAECDPSEWKRLTFERVTAGYASVLSIGDGQEEREACLGLEAGPLRRSVMLLDAPTPAQLVAQHVYLAQHLERLAQVGREACDLRLHRAPGGEWVLEPVIVQQCQHRSPREPSTSSHYSGVAALGLGFVVGAAAYLRLRQ